MTPLRVDQNTTLKQLQDFVGQAGDQAKIRGTRNPDQSITLYASEKKGTGLHNYRHDDRGDKRAAARDAVNMVLGKITTMHAPSMLAVTAALVPVRNQLGNAGELRGGTLTAALTLAETVKQTHVPREVRALEAVTSGDKTVIESIGREFGAHLASQVTTQSAQLNAMQVPGAVFKSSMLRVMAQNLGVATGPLATTYANASPEVKALVDHAYNHMMASLPDRMTDDSTLHLGGRDFAKGAKIGSGGHADVYLFTAKDGTGDQVAVKISNNTNPQHPGHNAEIRDNQAAELKAHRDMLPVGQNHAHVVGLKGAVAGPHGTLAMVMEIVPRGDGDNLKTKIDDLLTRGVITRSQANALRLTMVKDMLQGLQHAQGRNIVHLDLKPGNFFIDSQGRIKMGDFGTAEQGAIRSLKGTPVKNPLWQSPEILAGDEAVDVAVSKLKQERRELVAETKKDMQGKIDPDRLKAMIKRIDDRYDRAIDAAMNAGAYTVTGATDTWSIGASVFELFFGKRPFEVSSNFQSDNKQAAIQFGQNPNNRVRTVQNAGRQLDAVDNLLNEMMHPVPGQRPTAAQLLTRQVLNIPRVGSAETRALILAITDPNATDAAIQQAAQHV